MVVGEGSSAADVKAQVHSSASTRIELCFETESLAPQSIAAWIDVIDGWLAEGRSIHLEAAPQMLAHTLYKVGRLAHSNQLTITAQETEPYPG